MPDIGSQEFVPVLKKSGQDTLKQELNLPPRFGNLNYYAQAFLEYFRGAIKGNTHLSPFENPDSSASEQAIMGILNGPHAEILADKTRFPDLMRKIGYNSPRGLLITASSSYASRLKAVKKYFEENQPLEYFLKPLNAARQRGIRRVKPNELEKSLEVSEIKEDTLVQEFVPHEAYFRYIRYKSKSGKVYFACFRYKEKRSNKKHLVIPTVENTEVIEGKEADNLNQLIERLTGDVETEIGGKVNFLSLDIGVKDREKLSNEFDEQEMKDNSIFFETQATPGIWGIGEKVIPKPN